MRNSLSGKRWPTFWKKTRWLAAAALALGVGVTVYAVHDNGLFELDGNTVVNTPGLDDAESIYAKVMGDPTAAGTYSEDFSFDDFSPDPTYFGQGDKDIQNVSQWECTQPNNVGPKFNILNGFSGAYQMMVDGQPHTLLVAGADRESNNGSANVGIWLFQGVVGCDPLSGLGFQGQKTDGDILLVSEFTGGGKISTIIAYRWIDPDGVPDTGDEVLGQLIDPDNSVALTGTYNGDEIINEDDPFISGTDCTATAPDHHSTGSPDLCASVNASNITPAWTTDVRQPGQYFEAGVDLTALLGLGNQVCFNSFLLETRSSFETGADLKDFVGGQLNTCGTITIVKVAESLADYLSKEGSFDFDFTYPDASSDSFTLNTTDAQPSAQKSYLSLFPGSYQVDESSLSGNFVFSDVSCTGATDYTASNSANTGGNSALDITLGLGDNVTCTYTNTIAPGPGVVTINKVVLAGDTATSFGFTTDLGIPLAFNLTDGGSTQYTADASDTPYSVTETVPAGWELDSISCSILNSDPLGSYQINGNTANITILDGDEFDCTFYNKEKPKLRLVKQVVNDNGGTATASDWQLSAIGSGGFNGNGDTGFNYVDANTSYALSENGPSGYSASAWVCDGGNQSGASISLDYGEVVTCTITNDDISPTLTLVKTVINDNGGTLQVSDFPLFIDAMQVTSGAVNNVDAGSHNASETQQPGYTAGNWGGDCASDGSVTLALAENKTCTITNDDQPPSLTLIKVVVNDDGGTALASDWTLSATGPVNFSGAGPNVSNSNVAAGSYDLSENGPAGYAASDWVCLGGTQNDGDTVTLALGESAVCTITNDDIAPTLTLVKTVINDNGGTLQVSDFPLFISGNPAISGQSNTLSAGSYTASEIQQFGYQAGSWGGDCAADGSVTLALAENKTCTITNDDIAPTLTLIKVVVNDNGGTLQVGDFPLFIDATQVTSGQSNTLNAGNYSASETQQYGYSASGWSGDCAVDGSVSLSVGENKTCTITNDDIAPNLTLIKVVINDNGGTLQVSDFPLFIDAMQVTSGQSNNLSAGSYTASETQQFGYQASSWSGDCAANGSVSLSVGDSKTCTITNDDISPTLTLIKVVVNDDGGTLQVGDFPLFIDAMQVTSGQSNNVNAGSYNAFETQQPGYAAGSWTGDCAGDGSVSLSVGENKTCTITNNDIAPRLRVIKYLDPTDDGGLFNLYIDGGLYASDVGHNGTNGFVNVLANAQHTVSEQAGSNTNLDSYDATIGGDCAADGTITLGLDQEGTCTITNVKRGMAEVIKTVNGLPLMAGEAYTFEIRLGDGTGGAIASATASGPLGNGEAVSFSCNGTTENCVNVDGMAKLKVNVQYAFCETNMLPGWANTSLDGDTWFVPGGGNPDVDNSTECIAFTLSAGETRSFNIEDTPPPGGDARTIGFWKNHTSCDGRGNQDAVLDANLPITLYPGFVIGNPMNLDGDSGDQEACPFAVDLLDKRLVADPDVVRDGKKNAGDAAYGLAAQYIAYLLNQNAGAGTCPAASSAAAQAATLLQSISFDGSKVYFKGGKGKGDAALANSLAGTLDAYNNNNLCPQ
ncbi:hypothetical protein [Gallaecimonas pentaromativorans]|uniref:prealbumin-like fold domain-containing protein n=1 Tax=Gallaecimonas pentaromativorans TaxID=584787 RepID=UPI003A9582A5